MAIFQSRITQLVITFIITLAIALWLFRDNIVAIYSVQKDNKQINIIKDKCISSYVEKIDDFSIKSYSDEHLLLHYIEAETYCNFKSSPVLLLNLKVTQYDEQGQESYILKSNQANILNSGEILFSGEVNILSKGLYHEIKTESLVMNSKTKQISSNKDVIYSGENAIIFAQGMHINNTDDTMQLKGDIRIEQESESLINTKDLNIILVDGEKRYQTKEKSTYLSKDNTIHSEQGMNLDMKANLTMLLGKVKILQKSGTKILSHDLVVDQSNGGEVYKSNKPSNYQSETLNASSQGVYYDVVSQRLELIGGVVGRYE
jgi:LPS export ABC transporter protein LptC